MRWLSRFGLVKVIIISALAMSCGPGGNGERPASEVKSDAEPTETVSGPTVFIEVFPVFLSGGKPFVLLPGAKETWLLPMQNSEHPHDSVRRGLVDNSLEPEVIHSTSWRQDREKLIITYLAVIHNPESIPGGFEPFPVVQSGLVRGGATSPPSEIPTQAVINHAFQHLAWLFQTDKAVQDTLAGAWKDVLRPFQPQPFMSL